MATYYVKSGVATVWVASTAYTTERVVPTLAYATTAAKGRVYECTTPGTSGGTQPTWNTTVGGTTTDGTVTWTTRDITSWTNASPYLHYAVNYRNGASPQGGDTLYVSNNHAESVAQTVNFNSAGFTTPVNILCVNDGAIPPTTLATTATVTIIANSSISFLGFNYIYGISFNIGSTQTGAIFFNLATSSSGCKLYFDSCKLQLGTTGVGVLEIGNTGGPQEITLNNTSVQFGSTASYMFINGSFDWKNTPSALLGSIPTILFRCASSANILLDGVDISSTTGNILDGSGSVSIRAYLQNCKVNANFLTNVLSTAPSQPGYPSIKAHNCDSGATTYKLFEQNYYGSTRTETILVRTSGASDGTTPISWKMISASGSLFYGGLESPWISQWQNTTGSAKTATIEFLHDSLTALTNADIYAEVEYFATTNPGTSFANNRAADILATPVAHTTSSTTWTTTGLTNPNKQYLQVSFTPGMVGPVRVKIYLLKPSYTVYIDPLVTIA